MIIYQYRGAIKGKGYFAHLDGLLKRGAMNFTAASSFNDPFDCCAAQLHEVPEDVFPHAVGDMINRSMQVVVSRAHGIACFTAHPDSLLLWSHYGDQHRSICIGFDTRILLDQVQRNSEGNALYDEITKVEYIDSRPNADDKGTFFQKSTEWRYEEEYRLISCMKKGEPTWGPGMWNVPVSSIKEIVLGARMTPQDQQWVVELVKATGREIALKKAVPHMQEFRLLIEDLADHHATSPMSGSVLDPNGRWLKVGGK